jgi:hypothetical protein
MIRRVRGVTSPPYEVAHASHGEDCLPTGRRGVYLRAVAEIQAGRSGTASGVQLWAVSISDVRSLFHPTAETAEALRSDVPFHVASPYRPSRFLPFLRRDPGAPVLAPDSPLPADVDHLLHGHYVPPERLAPSWQIVTHWLDRLAAGTLRLDLDRADRGALDFDLARAGVAAHFALRNLWARDAALPLRPVPGSEVGYQRYGVACELGEAWRSSLEALEGSVTLVRHVSDWLAQLPTWAEDAEGAGHPAPDVFAVAYS